MRAVIYLFFLFSSLLSSDIVDIEVGKYRTISVQKSVKEVRVSSSKVLVDFDTTSKSLSALKIYGKEIGLSNLFILFVDGTYRQVSLNIVPSLGKIRDLIARINKNIKLSQNSGKIILEGMVTDKKEKSRLLEVLKKSGIDTEVDVIDLLNIEKPAKMIRVKLYVVEINNESGLTIKNDWATGYKNYLRNDYQSYTSEEGFIPTIANSMEGALTLSGGLTTAANYLGSGFSTGLILNYLKNEGVATILDETTLLSLENKDAKFHAGGTIYIKASSSTAEGIPTTEIRELEYGLLLKIKAKEIVNDKYIDLEIETESTKLNFEQVVDGIPGFSKKSILTTVVIKDSSTIILAGLINSTDAKSFQKVPLLGDIAIFGKLFRSDSFINDKSELVFFITPEIVDVSRD
jgi:pilus assembly protein CpaC